MSKNKIGDTLCSLQVIEHKYFTISETRFVYTLTKLSKESMPRQSFWIVWKQISQWANSIRWENVEINLRYFANAAYMYFLIFDVGNFSNFYFTFRLNG